ncbi:SIR2-like domain-containing protein [Ferrimonas sediminum]|uniref:SIR2-like domain-containing protein n=1 Tax=Ferrimonas sediminum TaxID=718193 RepID=A0A1G8YBK4_9GAMM|nr:SIR2 family protein [Ferrimonas sediminum]SDJ99625.1 SIR2-like domain-containing protein [Ferrimonas sediminum]
MTESVHNPDQYMYDFMQILTHGRKKVGLLIGAGGPVGINVAAESEAHKPLIPDMKGLMNIVLDTLEGDNLQAFKSIMSERNTENIEYILSHIRSLASVIGNAEVHGLNGAGYDCLSDKVCKVIKEVVNKDLPKGDNPYSQLISWVNGIKRDHAVEIFTTNYDLLFEEAMERVRTPYFDGFSGSKVAFFDPSTISNNDLPSRWIRLWKLHGSINWAKNENHEIVRGSGEREGTMVYPSHVKYDQTQAAPYSSLFERLKVFLLEPDSVLIAIGFSFADMHVTAKIKECLSANPTSALLAFQYNTLDSEFYSVELAKSTPNVSVYCRDGAVINGISALWKIGDDPTKNWRLIRGEYWGGDKFLLGDFVKFAPFLAKSGGSRGIVSNHDTNDIGEKDGI